MIKIYYSMDGSVELLDEPKKDCWINMIHPTEKEVNEIAGLYNIELDDLKAALDVDESTRLTVEDEYTLVLIDIPTTEKVDEKDRYVTVPLGLIICKDVIITVCSEKTDALDFFNGRKASSISTNMRTRILLTALLNTSKMYLKDLKEIYKESLVLEEHLKQSTENPALIEMMQLGKSLLYFSTSLKGNTVVLDKVMKIKAIKKYEEDEDLMEDVMIETKQAVETTEIYNGLLNGLMDAYASIISNNMNSVQKFIAVSTIALEIPNMIFGAYGMNVSTEGMPLAKSAYAFVLISAIAVILGILSFQYFNKKKLF